MARVVDTAGRPFSGQVPFAVLGICVSVKDPDELGRIRCLFPTLPKNKGKEPWSWWIRQQAPNAGKERGLYAVPEPLDEVLVVFLYGAQDIGIVVGQFWNGKDVPPAEAKDGMPKEADTDTGAKWSKELHTEGSQTSENNDRRFWRSRGSIKDEPPVGYEFAPEFEDTEVGDWHGHLIAFDDTPGKETLQVWDQTRKMAFIMDSKKHIIIMANVKIVLKWNIFNKKL